MLFWIIAIAVTAISCAALFYAAGGRTVNATRVSMPDANRHFGLVLAGIDSDVAAGKLGESEAIAAKGELAREVLRAEAEAKHQHEGREMGRAPLAAGLGGIALLAFGIYAVLGNPDMPSQPLESRPERVAQSVDLNTAIAQIEQALARNPDDVRGWTVIAPAYLELGRFDDAANAYRRIIALSGETADLQTSLAQALILGADGNDSPEAMDLLRKAAASDPQHVPSRFYIAAELTRQGDYPAAERAWQETLALAGEGDAWVAAAQQGLAAAQNRGEAPQANAQEQEMIGQMVSGLATRLAEQGGSIEEWTQLVRAYLVLGDKAKAQATFEAAVAAYPQAFDRGELDTLALGAGLTLKEAAR